MDHTFDLPTQQHHQPHIDWLNDVEQAENATVDIINSTSTILHLLGTTPTPSVVDAIDDDELSNTHIGKINDAVEQIFSDLNTIQLLLRKSFKFLSSEGISDPLPPFRNNLYLEERELELSTQTLDVTLAHIDNIQTCFGQSYSPPLPTSIDDSVPAPESVNI